MIRPTLNCARKYAWRAWCFLWFWPFLATMFLLMFVLSAVIGPNKAFMAVLDAVEAWD